MGSRSSKALVCEGEFLALQVENIDLRKSEIHVAWAVERRRTGVGVGSDADEEGRLARRADGDPVRQAIERQLGRRHQLTGAEPQGDEYVFPRNIDGTEPIRPDSLSDRSDGSAGCVEAHVLGLTSLRGDEDARRRRAVPSRRRPSREQRSHAPAALRRRTNLGKRQAMSVLEDDEPEE